MKTIEIKTLFAERMFAGDPFLNSLSLKKRKTLAHAMLTAGVQTLEDFETALNAARGAMVRAPEPEPIREGLTRNEINVWLKNKYGDALTPGHRGTMAQRLAKQGLQSELALAFAAADMMGRQADTFAARTTMPEDFDWH